MANCRMLWSVGCRPVEPADKVLCFNLGIAIEDLVTAVEIYRRAIAKSAGQKLPR